MSDTVTILSSSTGHSLSKAFIGESYVSNKFNPGTTFTASQVTVKDLDSLADLLRSLEAETVQAIARLRLVWADYQKRVFLLSNLPVEMPVDHLIEFNALMPDRLEMELIRTGDLPLTPLGLEKMRPDLGYAGASARKLFQSDRSKASDPKRLLTQLPVSVRTVIQIATFKAGDKRKTTHQHLFLSKYYSGSPTVSLYTPWTEAEVLAHLEQGLCLCRT